MQQYYEVKPFEIEWSCNNFVQNLDGKNFDADS